ncbi:sugar ABC transporter permease [Desertihabitans brevis]|uniref:Sugar ABC transporter permease n=1 Tax=Desertihabitans brevis TaxID=2268447 RepID=A0A367YUU2_9ACTN|nr:sugar ABC transporter permease [Desertihabitans brevis]RCK69656.1 sugar ABC transporter permease [Desertihabitans brevis]
MTSSTLTTGARVPAARAPGGGRRRSPGRGGLVAWTFALPALAVYAVFLIYPALSSLWFSFTDWDGLSPTYEVVGLDNYLAMASDPVVARAVANNLTWTVVTIVFPVVIGLALAILLNGPVRAKPVLRLIFYTPAVLPLVAVASIWGWLYNPEYGAINAALDAVGLDFLAQPWLGQDSTALGATMVPAIWLRVGFPMLLYLAALQGINADMYEAATVDGATRWQQFWHITMPSLRPAHYIVLALSLIDSFKVFDLVYAMTYGGPGTATQVMGTWMYFNVFQYYQAGYGTAIAVVITVVAVAVGIPYVRSQTKEHVA